MYQVKVLVETDSGEKSEHVVDIPEHEYQTYFVESFLYRNNYCENGTSWYVEFHSGDYPEQNLPQCDCPHFRGVMVQT